MIHGPYAGATGCGVYVFVCVWHIQKVRGLLLLRSVVLGCVYYPGGGAGYMWSSFRRCSRKKKEIVIHSCMYFNSGLLFMVWIRLLNKLEFICSKLAIGCLQDG